ncbi:MAG: hypothetical protein QF735_08395, partial [Phycisphaeraceae bacterium]|nr:hypothetical protein [Phycisphaeraceae bacterium]
TQPGVVAQALAYADAFAHDPHLTKSGLAEQLGVSRIRVYQFLNILKLPPAIIEFLLTHDSPDIRAIFTERRLRPLTRADDQATQVQLFRQLVRELPNAGSAP